MPVLADLPVDGRRDIPSAEAPAATTPERYPPAHAADEAPWRARSAAAHAPGRELNGKSDETNLTGRHVSVASVLVTASLVTAACSSTPVTVTNPAAPSRWRPGPGRIQNGDLADTRDAAGSTITSANVSGLKQAWTFHITGPAAAGIGPDGALAANPIVVNRSG
jgi:hypothetical protein